MNKVIHKHPVRPGENVIEFPKGAYKAQALDIQVQQGIMVVWILWTLSEDDLPTWTLQVDLVPTGSQDLDGGPHGEYVGTVMEGNWLVWHAFVNDRFEIAK